MLRQHKDAIRDGLLRYITALLLGAGRWVVRCVT